jgi:hypothetical protein
MQKYLKQAAHNKAFHECIEQSFSKKFYDWKVTVLFYIAIHCLKALATNLKVEIGDTHREIENNINPDRPQHTLAIKRTAFKNYRNLYQYSKTARYEGFTDFDTFEKLKEVDHSYCLKHLSDFQKYIESRGISLENCIIKSE